MNEEIKKETFEDYLLGYFQETVKHSVDPDDMYCQFDEWYHGLEIYELSNLAELWSKQAYLQGAKAVIEEVKKFNRRNAILRQEPTTRSVKDLEEKLAQQFIDSLEKTNE